MSNPTQPPEGLILWLQQARERLEHLLSPDSPLESQQRVQALIDMSQGFLALSKGFLELGMKASQGAERLIRPSGKNGSESAG